jgi:hypothetical protein
MKKLVFAEVIAVLFVMCWAYLALGQAVIPYSRMGLTQEQIQSCSHLFGTSDQNPEPKPTPPTIPCYEIKELWINYCK